MHGINCISRYDNVMQTWGKDIDTIFFSDYEDKEKKIYKTTGLNEYSGLEDKIVNAVKSLYKKFSDYDWYLLCDDDTFVNVGKLYSEINNFNEDKVYGKILYHLLPDKEVAFHSGGGGTLISNKVMKLLSKTVKNHGLGIADVSIGMNLDRLGIKKENSYFFISSTPSSHGIKEENYRDYITLHHINNFEMMDMLYKKTKNINYESCINNP